MQYLANGIVLGSIYGLISVAYTLIYGVAGIVNFAFGGIFMFGAYGALYALSPPKSQVTRFATSLGLPLWWAVLVGLATGAVVGFIAERVAYRPLRGRSTLTLLIASLAALIMLQALGQFIFGAGETPYPSLAQGKTINLAGAVISQTDILVIIIGFVATGLLWTIVRRTPWGRAMRAIAQDSDTAKLMGINIESVIIGVFVAGSIMAALSGILYGSLFGSASPTMGYTPGLEGLVAAVLGGIGNLPGAFIGGLFLGLTETLAAAYLPNGLAYQDVVAFIALVLILWVRPQGLLGLRVRERA